MTDTDIDLILLQNLTVPYLKQICRSQKIEYWGTKKIMIDRILRKCNMDAVAEFVEELRAEERRRRKKVPKPVKKMVWEKFVVNNPNTNTTQQSNYDYYSTDSSSDCGGCCDCCDCGDCSDCSDCYDCGDCRDCTDYGYDNNYIDDISETDSKFIDHNIQYGNCTCCRNRITYENFHCGFVVSKKNGGEVKVDNLRPVCTQCYKLMKNQNMADFMIKPNQKPKKPRKRPYPKKKTDKKLTKKM